MRPADARKKMNAAEAKRRSVALDVSDMAISREEIVEKVRPFLDDGTFDAMTVVDWPDAWTMKKDGTTNLGS